MRKIFALKHGHDGALLLHIFDGMTCEFAPLLHSIQNTTPVDIYEIPQPLKESRGTRHQSSAVFSKLTNALVVTVSEERGTISTFHRGEYKLDIDRQEFMGQLHTLLLEAMNKEVSLVVLERARVRDTSGRVPIPIPQISKFLNLFPFLKKDQFPIPIPILAKIYHAGPSINSAQKAHNQKGRSSRIFNQNLPIIDSKCQLCASCYP